MGDSLNKQPQLVSVMMPAYNAERYIAQAIESILAQSYSCWELIVVNDGSTDGTQDILAHYTDSRIRIFQQANSGEAGARNTVLDHIRGEYVTFLDADDVYLPNHLEVIAGYLQAHPDRDGVYTDGYYCDQDGVRLKALSSRRRGPFEGDIFEQMARSSDVFGAPVCVGLRSDAIARQGLRFDPDIVIGPDWDFLTHFSENSLFGYVNQSTCLYRVHHTNISVRTNARKRALSLARCREKVIKMERFDACSIETRAFVFYDLLINLLAEMPERQVEITKWPEFRQLPAERRATLYRLMARKALVHDTAPGVIGEWLKQSRMLNPSNLPGAVLSLIYSASPGLCKRLLSVQAKLQPEPLNSSPFADLFQG